MLKGIKTILHWIARLLEGLRLALTAVVIGLIVGGLAALFWESTPTVPEQSVLVIELSGKLVDEGGVSSDTVLSLARGNDPETRLRDVIDALRLAQNDERSGADMMRVEGVQSAGLASLHEIGVAMDRFKASGKRISVWSTSYSQKQYAVAAHASAVYMHPMGQVSLKGLASSRLYWGDALRALGVTVHVFKAGTYKSAPESMVLNAPSKDALKADRYWIEDEWRQLRGDIESARGLMPGAVDKLIEHYVERLEKAQGDTSRLAHAENLIDGIVTRDEMRRLVLESKAGSAKNDEPVLLDYLDYLDAVQTHGSGGKHVAVITLEGEIKDGADGPGMAGERGVIGRIRAAAKDPSVAAVVMRINSPGGSAVASELIRRELELVREAGKPVVASLGDTAASGGYWVALAADRIIADPMSLTGSIGVFGMVPTFERSMQKLAIGSGGVATTWMADAEDPTRALKPEYERMLELSVARTYRDFTNLVHKSRKLSPEKVASLGEGRVYTGAQAVACGLADTLGGLQDAVDWAADKAGVSAADVLYFSREPSRFSMLLTRLLYSLGIEPSSAVDPLWESLKSLIPVRNAQGVLRVLSLVSAPEKPYALVEWSMPE